MNPTKSILSCISAISLLLCPVQALKAQTSTLAPVSCDCASAIPISVHQLSAYGPAIAPAGFGTLQEIKAKSKNSKTAFQQEHHSAWYLLKIEQEGDLVMEIKATDSNDDYDFLIFPYTDTQSCRLIQEDKIKALRGNLSRNISSNGGVTGLSAQSLMDFHQEGPGEQFSKSLYVKKGEQYLLVLDNVHEKGQGHRLSFGLLTDIKIEGIVNNEEGKAVKAEVILLDGKGTELSKTTSTEDGNYSMDTKIIPNAQYSLTFTNDHSFLATESINTMFLKDKQKGFTALKTVLPELKKGRNYPMNDILFEGNSAKIVPRSNASLVSLLHLMRRNKQLVIQIEGHVNGVPGGLPPSLIQQLSEERAETVYKYLLRKGIEPGRLSKIGLGKSRMIYPNPKNLNEHEANRRVEIKVVDF